MKKPRQKRPQAVALDHGTAIRLARGDVAVADRPDPDAPNRTVRGAKALDPLDRIAGLSKRAALAGRRYLEHWQTVNIGRTPSNDGVYAHVHPAHRVPHGEAVAHSNGKLIHAAQVMGMHGEAVVVAVVVKGNALETAYARLWPAAPACIPRTAADRVLAALSIHLERLANAWGL